MLLKTRPAGLEVKGTYSAFSNFSKQTACSSMFLLYSKTRHWAKSAQFKTACLLLADAASVVLLVAEATCREAVHPAAPIVADGCTSVQKILCWKMCKDAHPQVLVQASISIAWVVNHLKTVIDEDEAVETARSMAFSSLMPQL